MFTTKNENLFQKGDILQAVRTKDGILLSSEKSCIIPCDSIMKATEDASDSNITVIDANGNLCKTSVSGLTKGYRPNSRVRFFSNKQRLCSTLSNMFLSISLVLFISALVVLKATENYTWTAMLIIFGIVFTIAGESLPTPFALNTYDEYKILIKNTEKDEVNE